jgi:hypothetical protein
MEGRFGGTTDNSTYNESAYNESPHITSLSVERRTGHMFCIKKVSVITSPLITSYRLLRVYSVGHVV